MQVASRYGPLAISTQLQQGRIPDIPDIPDSPTERTLLCLLLSTGYLLLASYLLLGGDPGGRVP
jgi:hypothetical protein